LVGCAGGSELWPDAYDYRADGMQRLEMQLKNGHPEGENQAAGEWKALLEISGDRGAANIFRAWADIEPDNAQTAVGRALANLPEGKRLTAWWTNAAPVLVQSGGS
jgi:hypothetical protein